MYIKLTSTVMTINHNLCGTAPRARCGNSRTSQSRHHKNHRRINSSTLAIGGLSECDFKIQKLLLSAPKYSPIRQDCLRFWLDNNNF